ncbi:MAG: tetratricopeptide repeat protein [Bacteroidetes bacterium]|nr:MAG: tetratricopeptide repeat protein [Bacteroidota bacterium]
MYRVPCSMLRAVCLSIACCPLSILFFSCGNEEGEQQAVSSNDSTPADIRAINEKINSDRNNPNLYVERSKAYLAHKDFEAAISDMKIALSIDSSKASYYIFLSDLYFTQNKTRDTRDMLRRAMQLDTGNAEAMMKYSQLFYLLRKYDTAIFFINRSLHFDRANATANFQKGMILKEAGDTAKSILGFQSAVELNPDYFDAYMQLGILFSIKKNPLAVEYFNTALKIEPKSIEALYGMGKFLQDAGQYDNALKSYENLLAISPENPDAVFNMGAVYYEQKKFKEAIKMFERTLQRDVNFHRGYYGRGRCYEALGEKQKAMDDYRHCLAIKPDFDLAAIQLDIALRKK